MLEDLPPTDKGLANRQNAPSSEEGPFGFLSRRVPLLTEWINERAEGPGARVSTTTLYEGADRGENASRVGSWIKGRWCLKTVDLEEASAAFESACQGIRRAAVVSAEPACYVLCA